MTETAVRKGSEPEIDEELLAEAQRGLGTASRNETLNAALHEYVMCKRERRRAGLERLQEMADEGLLDFSTLDDADR